MEPKKRFVVVDGCKVFTAEHQFEQDLAMLTMLRRAKKYAAAAMAAALAALTMSAVAIAMLVR